MGLRSDFIELQLAHVERNRVRAAYNHADHLAERAAMMQTWADWLETVATVDSGAVSQPGQCGRGSLR
nr:hypothetical protein [Hyphomonas sp.]